MQLDRLTSLAKVLCHSIIIMHSPLGKQMLVEAREKNGGFKMAAPYGACWVISWKLPLNLGGYVLNDIWTIVQNHDSNL